MDQPVIDLMHDCVVKLIAPAPGATGTGFFVAPGWILTCAHVVGDLKANKHCVGEIQMRWKNNPYFAIATVEKWEPNPDIALLSYTTDQNDDPPCVLLGRKCKTSDRLAAFGYPRDFPNGAPATFECSGYTGDIPNLIMLKLDNIQRGMSGSPVLNMETKRVCGMVKFTVDPNGIRGGGGISVDTIFDHFNELIAFQDEYHQQNTKWFSVIGAKTPGDLLEVVETNIAERLEDPSLAALKDNLGNFFTEKVGFNVRSPSEIASKLVEFMKEDTFSLLFLAQKNTTLKMERKQIGAITRQYILEGVFDILGWLVLLAVNSVWLSENRNEIYPEQFPGAIVLPVKTDIGVEIIHAALNRRCARFNIAKGNLYGTFRMPEIDHSELPESGISKYDPVNEIKRSIWIYMNKYWNKDKSKLPDHFSKDHNEELNTQLKFWNNTDQGRYLVVRRSENDCSIGEEVYRELKSDLPDLQVIFHFTGGEGPPFSISEISLSTQLRNFLI